MFDNLNIVTIFQMRSAYCLALYAKKYNGLKRVHAGDLATSGDKSHPLFISILYTLLPVICQIYYAGTLKWKS